MDFVDRSAYILVRSPSVANNRGDMPIESRINTAWYRLVDGALYVTKLHAEPVIRMIQRIKMKTQPEERSNPRLWHRSAAATSSGE